MIMLDYAAYRRKLRGCFVGKAIGGTLGMPMEGYLGTKEVTYYDPVPTGMVANDDLDLQVVWLEVIRRCGLPVNRRDLADGWLEHMRALPDEYGVAVKNLETGLYPPMSGYYDNKFYAGMGAAIRTELWAALAPGDPDLAVRLAREDACVDHCADGVEASTFLAAVESAAYVESDRQRLIHTGLSYLDPQGRMYHAFTDTIRWWEEYRDPLAVREKILTTYFRQNWTDVAINLSFILLSWMAGEGDFGKSICTAAGLGYDADCTAATLGAILGTINPDGFEERWTRPLGDDLVLSACISNMHEVATITALCDQVADLCQQVLEYYGSNSQFTAPPALQTCWAAPWAPDNRLVGLRERYRETESLISVRPFTIRLIYPERVALAPGEAADFTALISNPLGGESRGTLQLHVPDGWAVEPQNFELELEKGREQTISFSIKAPDDARRRIPRNPLDFRIVCGDCRFEASAGLVQTIDFLRVACDYDGEECPPDALFRNAVKVSAAAHFQPVPEGRHLYMAELRAPALYPETILVAQGTRPLKVWLDGRLILDHDGCEYVPTFHRSDYVAVLPLNGSWQRLVIQTGEEGRKGEKEDVNRSPGAARVPIPGNPSMFEIRKKYDAEKLYQGEPGEIFIGFASLTGTHWLSELEWKIPQLQA